MAAELEVVDVFPQLLPQDNTRRFYHGFITICNQNFGFSLKIPESGVLKDARVECSWKLRHLLRGYEGVVTQRLNQCDAVVSFLVELKSLVEKLLQCQRAEVKPAPLQPTYYAGIISEMEAIGWNRLVYVDPSFSIIKLRARDRKEREHMFTVHLSSQHPSAAPTCKTELPGSFHFTWTSQDNPLQQLYQQFEKELDQHEEFWDVVDEVDKNTWVLEPDHPSRSCTLRRLALGNNASIQIDINPSQPRALPECRFLGADNVIIPLRDKLNSNLHSWDPSLSLLTNLQTLLGRQLPSPSTNNREDFSTECGICYAYRMNDVIPDKVCDDPRCGQQFHASCLYEWLKSLPSCRQSFNMVFGECPYCGKPLNVKMATTDR